MTFKDVPQGWDRAHLLPITLIQRDYTLMGFDFEEVLTEIKTKPSCMASNFLCTS